VPLLWRSEFLNIVTLHFRKNLINYIEALDAIEKGIKLIGAREHEVSAFAAMEFVQQSNCSPYDCEFIALADRLNVNLVTYDKQILNTFPMLAVPPEEYIKHNKIRE
jgi:predicted nucleic acid-binding protein